MIFKNKNIDDIKALAEDKVNRIKIETETETNIVLTKIVNENKIHDVMFKKYKNEINKLDMLEQIERMKLKREQADKVTSKAIIYKLIALICTLVSGSMTICGINNITKLQELEQIIYNPSTALYTLLIAITQFIIYYASANATYLKDKFNSIYKYINIFTVGMIIVSFSGNIKFLNSLIKPVGADYIFIIIPSLAIDFFSILFADLGNNAKYRNYDNDKLSDLNIIETFIQIKLLPVKTRLKKQLDIVSREYQEVVTNDLSKDVLREYQEVVTNDLSKDVLSEDKEIVTNDLSKDVLREDKEVVTNILSKDILREDKEVVTNDLSKDVLREDKEVVTNILSKDVLREDKEVVTNDLSKDKEVVTNILSFPDKKNKNLKLNNLKKDDIYNNILNVLLNQITDDSPVSRSILSPLVGEISEYNWKKLSKKLLDNNLIYKNGTKFYKQQVSKENINK